MWHQRKCSENPAVLHGGEGLGTDIFCDSNYKLFFTYSLFFAVDRLPISDSCWLNSLVIMHPV